MNSIHKTCWVTNEKNRWSAQADWVSGVLAKIAEMPAQSEFRGFLVLLPNKSTDGLNFRSAPGQYPEGKEDQKL